MAAFSLHASYYAKVGSIWPFKHERNLRTRHYFLLVFSLCCWEISDVTYVYCMYSYVRYKISSVSY